MFNQSVVRVSACLGVAWALALALAWAPSPSHADPVSSEADAPQITVALRRFATDRRDIGARFAQQAYERIPRELRDFQRDAALLEVALADQSVELRSGAAVGLKAVADAFAHLSITCGSRDETAIGGALAELDSALAGLYALFPVSARP